VEKIMMPGASRARSGALCLVAATALLGASCEGGEPTFLKNDTGGPITLTLAGTGPSCRPTPATVAVAAGDDLALQECFTYQITELFYDRSDGSRCVVDLQDLRLKTTPFKYSEVYFWDTLDEVRLAAVKCRDRAPREALQAGEGPAPR
jgi:hypothetical protein